MIETELKTHPKGYIIMMDCFNTDMRRIKNEQNYID